MRSIIKKTWFPLALFLLDVLIIGGGNAGAVVSLLLVFYFVVKALIDMFRSADKLKADLVKVAIYAVTLAAIVCGLILNNKLASGRAEAVIAALEKYKAENNSYPDKLGQLVPKFLPAVPAAKIGLYSRFSQFYYVAGYSVENKGEARHLLEYYTAPPFGMQVYTVEEKSWGFSD